MKKNLTFLFAITQFMYWTGFASIMAFVSIYLLDIHVKNAMIGIVIAAGGILSALSQPVLGTLSDRFAFFSVRRIMTVLLSLIVLSAAALLMTHGGHPVFACIIYGCCIMALQQMQPFVNALGMRCLNDGYQLDFGIARAVGSAGYASVAFALGLLSERLGTAVIPAFILGAFVLLGVTLVFYPGRIFAVAGQQEQKREGADSLPAFIRRYPRFAVLLAGLILIYYGHTLINSFTFQIIQTKGGGNSEMGIATALAAVLELFMMFLFTRIMKRFSLKLLLRVSACFFTLKVAGSLLAPDVLSYYLVQILQMLGWAIMSVALVYYVNRIMAGEDRVKGQTYATMTYTVGSVLGAWIGGLLIDVSGVQTMLSTGVLISGIGTLIAFFGTAEKPNQVTDIKEKM